MSSDDDIERAGAPRAGISDHAMRRIRERMGLPRRAVRRAVERARLSPPVASFGEMSAMPGAHFRRYGRWLFVFADADLTAVTVLPIDGEDKHAFKLERMRREAERMDRLRRRSRSRTQRREVAA